MSQRLRLVCVMVGDVHRQSDMQIKYGGLLDSLSRQFDLVDVFDASLRGFDRYWNAIQTFHPRRKRWKERFFKNVQAFKMRSIRVVDYLSAMQGHVDLVLQIGATFDSAWGGSKLPVVVYTDNTTHITARSTDESRFPFSKSGLISWLALEGQIYNHAVHICVRSDMVRRSLLHDYKIPESRITVVGGGVNFSSLPTVDVNKSSSAPTVLFIGQNFHRKGGDLVLRAFAQARIHVPEAKLYCVTEDIIPEGLPLEGVKLIPLTWDRNFVVSLYRQADVLVLPSRHETWGDVLLEAMSFGIPCIGVTGQAMEEIVRPNETGILVPPENVDALREALTRLLSQPDLRNRMGETARLLVGDEFTWDRVVGRLAVAIQKNVTC